VGASRSSIFFAMDHFDWPLTKKSWCFFVLLKRSIFYQYGIVVVFPFSHLYTIHDHTFGQKIWDKLWCYWNILDGHFLLHFGSLHCLSKIYIPNFVHHHFSPKRLQKIGYLLWFTLIGLICCHASQDTSIFKVFFWLAMGHFDFVIILVKTFVV